MVGDNEKAPVLTGFEYLAGDTVKVGIEVFDADDWEVHIDMNIQANLCTPETTSAIVGESRNKTSPELGLHGAVLCLSRHPISHSK